MKPNRKPPETPAKAREAEKPEQVDVADSGWQDTLEPVHRTFPGTVNAGEVPLRIAFTRGAYAEVVAHTKENLESEVAGVLVGEVCEDGELFVSVTQVIRGASTRQGTTHVTFTHETWNQIHEKLDQDYPDLQIVGWYHSHPGFGVEFSRMDKFIQENFFTGPTQFALVTDPLGGAVAIIINRKGGTVGVDRFWVDGREHKCTVTAEEESKDAKAVKGGKEPVAAASTAKGGGGGSADIVALQKRVSQLTTAVEEMRATLFRFLFAAFLVVALAVTTWIVFFIFAQITGRQTKELNIGQIMVPVGNTLAPVSLRLVYTGTPTQEEATIQSALDVFYKVQMMQLQQQLNALPKDGAAPKDSGKPAAGDVAPTPKPETGPAPSPGATPNPAPGVTNGGSH